MLIYFNIFILLLLYSLAELPKYRLIETCDLVISFPDASFMTLLEQKVLFLMVVLVSSFSRGGKWNR